MVFKLRREENLFFLSQLLHRNYVTYVVLRNTFFLLLRSKRKVLLLPMYSYGERAEAVEKRRERASVSEGKSERNLKRKSNTKCVTTSANADAAAEKRPPGRERGR